jgi:hypothetical protein
MEQSRSRDIITAAITSVFVIGYMGIKMLIAFVVAAIALFSVSGCAALDNADIINEYRPAYHGPIEAEVYEVIEFAVLPNGTRVDIRVDDEIVDLVFRHFQAIEDGNVMAFRETLQGQDGASMNMHIELILAYFWDIVVAGYEDEMFYYWRELTEFGRNRAFFEEHEPISRNTGMFIKEIKYPHDGWCGGVVVVLTSYEHDEMVYTLGLLNDFGWPGVEWHNPAVSWFDVKSATAIECDYLEDLPIVTTAAQLS